MQLITGHVFNVTGQKLSNATVFAVNDNLQPVGISSTTNSEGMFSLWGDFYSGDSIVASSLGYRDQVIPIENTNADTKFYLPRDVTVTSNKNKFPAWILLLPLVAMADKKKSVGKIQPNTIFLAAGGLIGFSLVQKLLVKLGIWTGAGSAAVQTQQTNPGSIWKPLFWHSAPAGSWILTDEHVADYAKRIHNAFTVFNDDFNAIFSVFTLLQTQTQVSYLAEFFQKKYGEDLLSFLTDGGGILPWDGLNETHLKTITDLVNRLPKYKP